MKKEKKGFTLVEVVIVLAIIAVIAAIAIPNLSKVREDSKEKSDDRSIEAIVKIVERLVIVENIKPLVKVTITIEPGKSVTLDPVDAELRDIDDEFIGVKKPQENGVSKYEITIDESGDITGKTIK